MFDFLSPSATSTVIQCADSDGCLVVHSLISTALVLFILLTGFAYTTVLERRFIAWIQDRIGPNRVGPKGMMQPAADGIKLVFKEDIIPINADKPVYMIAPMLKVIPALVLLAVVPLGPPITVPWFDGKWYHVAQGLIDVNVGVLWLLAITSISVYGVAMAGWASANKYAMIGSLRASAAMISYELPLGASFLVPAMLAGSLSVGDIIEAQSGNFIFNWFIFQNPLAALIMLTALIAEINRAPFDLPEAEQELVAGHMTEYSGMRFAMFFMAEYIGMIAVSVIFSSMFLGGYHFILVDDVPLLGPLWLTLKVVALLAFMIWLRATLPRVRYDRLMSLGWKILLPLSLLAMAWTATIVVLTEEMGSSTLYPLATFALLIVLGIAAFIFGRKAPNDDYSSTQEVEVVNMGGGGIGYVVMQLVGSLVAVPFMLFNYQVQVLKNLRAALPETSTPKKEEPKDGKEVTVYEHS
jgi:NADH-quinone oxidoreductase subunit H